MTPLEFAVLLVVTALAVVLSFYAIGLARSVRVLASTVVAREQIGLEPGTRAPGIDLTALTANGSATSARIPASDRAAVLVFVAPNCHDCHRVAPLVDQAHSQLGNLIDVRFIVAGDANSARRFRDDIHAATPMLADPSGEAAHLYGARKVPLGVFISADGRVSQSIALTAQNAAQSLADFARPLVASATS